MKTALIVVGLPASGKTHYLNQLEGYKVYDDMSFDIEHETADVIALSHPEFCDNRIRTVVTDRLVLVGYQVRTVYYQNDPVQCTENAKRRPDRKVKGYISYLSNIYNPPKDSIPVWHP